MARATPVRAVATIPDDFDDTYIDTSITIGKRVNPKLKYDIDIAKAPIKKTKYIMAPHIFSSRLRPIQIPLRVTAFKKCKHTNKKIIERTIAITRARFSFIPPIPTIINPISDSKYNITTYRVWKVFFLPFITLRINSLSASTPDTTSEIKIAGMVSLDRLYATKKIADSR